jgi:hypothetical protein
VSGVLCMLWGVLGVFVAWSPAMQPVPSSILRCVPCPCAERRFWLTMRGGSPGGGSYLIASTPSVQLSIRLAISIEEFFGPLLVQNIATLLQVRVCVCWRKG